MALQAEISDARSKSMIGKTIDVLIDEVDEDGAVGRSKADAPEIDGEVFLSDAANLKSGDIIKAVVTAGDQSDLWADPVKQSGG